MDSNTIDRLFLLSFFFFSVFLSVVALQKFDTNIRVLEIEDVF